MPPTPCAPPRALAAVITPHGALRLESVDGEATIENAEAAARIQAAFARGAGHGLAQRGLAEAGGRLPADLAFWRSFALRFTAARCAGGGACGMRRSARPCANMPTRAPRSMCSNCWSRSAAPAKPATG
ncbi:hypothetical protein CCR94_22120 [Rhodoblastus sphagnicola]|uniref:Uncharacterized protein n=1 Tax=Rhodoblastus sphagnicola TaxID=333368 RepID=A0A2S6MVE6_9HYPH|nr:hypothetical protein CCR94_22120 [Rhodoblastus sphagnicola]